MRLLPELELDYNDVLILPQRSTLTSRHDVDLGREFVFRNSHQKYFGTPLIGSNMAGVGTPAMAKKLSEWGMITCLCKDGPFSRYEDLRAWEYAYAPTFGMTGFDKILAVAFVPGIGPHLQYVHIDAANGYQEAFVEAVAKLRKLLPDTTIIAGAVCTGEMTQQLILAGADIVRVGIGSGGHCLTRVMTGVGRPQLSAIIDCANAAHGLDGHIAADGGVVYPGDVAKAFGAGADFVMIGSMFAGHDESGMVKERNVISSITGEDVIEKYVPFYGNSAEPAQTENKPYRTSEGRVSELPYRGPVSNTVGEILGGLRSALTYTGSRKLKELPKRCTFVRCNQVYNKSYEEFTVGK